MVLRVVAARPRRGISIYAPCVHRLLQDAFVHDGIISFRVPLDGQRAIVNVLDRSERGHEAIWMLGFPLGCLCCAEACMYCLGACLCTGRECTRRTGCRRALRVPRQTLSACRRRKREGLQG
jgi:hypothetical protein